MSPRHGEGAVCLSACECHKIHFLVQPMAGTPQGRVPVDPHPFFGTSLPSTCRDVKEVQPGEGEGSIKLQPVPQPRGSAMSPALSPGPHRRARPRGQHREARHGPGLIEPGSFIYTVKVTSNFLRLSCSSAIKSWRGQEQPPRPPARGGDTSGSPSRDTHGPRRLCNCQRDLATTGHSFRRLCLYSSSHFYFVLFRVFFFFNLAILFFFFLEHRTHTRRKALLQS